MRPNNIFKILLIDCSGEQRDAKKLLPYGLKTCRGVKCNISFISVAYPNYNNDRNYSENIVCMTIFYYVFTGLQMVEEFEKYHDHMYYKCNLCAAHGKLDAMYHHLIGNKHTERYIVSSWRNI